MTTPPMMTAIAVQGGRGPAEALHPEQRPVPQPGPGQILIKVAAAGVNRPDILQRQGTYPPPPGAPDTLGMEVAGEVAACGAIVEGTPLRWLVGDRVCALLGGGGYAEYAVVDARHAMPIPTGLNFIQAASLPETAFTVFSNVFERSGLKAGETLLVHGATSGIGVMAVQMGKAAGARVIATSRSAAKADQARALGADLAIDTAAEDFVQAVRAAGGADVILDMVGGDFVPRDLLALRPDGRLAIIAVQSGATAEIDLGRMLVNRLTVTGSTLRGRGPDEKARLAQAVEATVWPWIAAGKIVPVIDRTFPLKEASAAHAWLEAGSHLGKVVLLA